MRITLLCILSIFLFGGSPPQDASKKKTIMAIFAHPDDEMTVGPILSKYAREGVHVYLVICTDGRYGTNDFSGLKAGDGLAALRREEMKCSASILGAELIHLTYHDQLKAAEGYDGHMPHAQSLILELHRIISEKQPDVLITWGPDGGTSHMDHRLVGASVTQVFESKRWGRPTSLFFVGTPSNLVEDANGKILRGIEPSLLNVQIPYTEEDLQTTAKAIACHKSQLRDEDVAGIVASRRKNGLTIYLREFTKPTRSRNSVF